MGHSVTARDEPADAHLMPTPTPAKRESFKRSQDFKHSDTGRGWVCTVCPTTRKGQPSFSSFKAALNHERTAHERARASAKHDKIAHETAPRVCSTENHLQSTEEICSDKIDNVPLTSEGLRQWEMHAHVDHVFDLVPFWQRGIDAAERGEVLRLEEFLEKMEGDGGWRTASDVLGMLVGSPSERARDYGEPAWSQPCPDVWAVTPGWEPNPFDWARSQRGGWGAITTHAASDVTESSRGRVSDLGSKHEWGESTSDFKPDQHDRHNTNDVWGTKPDAKLRPDRRGLGNREDVHHFVDIVARQGSVDEERRKQMHIFFEMPTEQKIKKIQETIRILRAHMVNR